MAQQNKIFTLPSGVQVDLSFISQVHPPNNLANDYGEFGTYQTTQGVGLKLQEGDYPALIQARKEYGEFQAQIQKGGFAFGYSACELLGCGINFLQCLRANCADGCIDSATPPNPSEPMVKQPPTDQEPPTNTQD